MSEPAEFPPDAPSHEPPGLGGLLMAIGGAVCVIGGLLSVSSVHILISAPAANLLLKGLPLLTGGTMVVLGASVRRALRRERALGAADSARLVSGSDEQAPRLRQGSGATGSTATAPRTLGDR